MNSSSPNTLIINSYNSHSIADCSSPVNRTSSRPVNVGGNFVIRNGVRLRYLLRAEWRLVPAGGEVRPTLVQVADGPLERVETAPVPGPATRVLRYCHITPDLSCSSPGFNFSPWEFWLRGRRCWSRPTSRPPASSEDRGTGYILTLAVGGHCKVEPAHVGPKVKMFF